LVLRANDPDLLPPVLSGATIGKERLFRR